MQKLYFLECICPGSDHLAHSAAFITFATVKTIGFIFSVYFLLLSANPCCLEDACADEIKPAQAGHCSQDQDEDDCNSCSPFFTCGACSGFVFSTAGLVLKELTLSKANLVNVYKTQFIDDFVARIWQPPKVG